MSGPIRFVTPLAEIEGIPARTREGLAALGVRSVGELLVHFPTRHETQEAESPIGALVADRIGSARGEVAASRVVGRGRSTRAEVVLQDGTGRLDLVFFNQPYRVNMLRPGVRVRVQGHARARGYGLQMANPRVEIIRGEGEPARWESRLRPVYPASERVSSEDIERAARIVVPLALDIIEDHLPEAYRKEREMPELRDAYRMVHMPGDEQEAIEGRRRLAYDELLLLQLGVQMKRHHRRATLHAPALRTDGEIDARIRARFPFTLTPGQEKVIEHVRKDLASTTPASRLIQGDVGSGKTLVALYAMLAAAASGHQAALMAPTELLAEQHHASISEMLKGSRLRVELLTGSLPRAERESVLARIAAGEVDLVIGTHALTTEGVRFASLGVAIIDEQHRFGVHQRAALRSKVDDPGSTPHVLVMTATPIPRTMAIALFGDLDVSTIEGMPPGRSPVRTRVVDPGKREVVYRWLATQVGRKRQAYVVVPTIESGSTRGTGAMRDLRGVVKYLEEHALPGRRIAAVHGRLKRETRERIMHRFRSGQIDVLVATTVIEVGVDVPGASVMIVEHAERFGLAQLHQLRGRVGRGSVRSDCVLIGEATTPDAQQRLEAIASISDGFALAEKDFDIRGPGELFGVRQSGMPPFRIADMARDIDLLRMASRDAAAWIERSPRLDAPEESRLSSRLHRAHGKWLGLGDVA
ncbi:MAG: ATP-dependent DNA helicase RecG [Phycisphaerales bacterium]|jgi:ATP-dependent DNA helicase RecG|nr:ATP-dependent DNA helicase RecG [Phycisphaerales bacterium]